MVESQPRTRLDVGRFSARHTVGSPGAPSARRRHGASTRSPTRSSTGCPCGSTAATGADWVSVYFHGGGFVIGSIGLMDNVARESLMRRAGSSCPSSTGSRPSIRTGGTRRLRDGHPVGGRDPASSECRRPGGGGRRERRRQRGGAAVTLRLRDAGTTSWPARRLVYPGMDGPRHFPPVERACSLVLSRLGVGPRRRSRPRRDPFATPIHAEDPEGLPPGLVACSVAATGCETRAGRTRRGYGVTAWRSRRCASRASRTGS